MSKRKRSQAEEDLVPKITQSVISNLIKMGILPATQGPSTAAQVPAPAPETTMPATTIPDAMSYTSGTGVPLSTGVDPKLKAKVWGDQYLPVFINCLQGHRNAIHEAEGRWFHLL